MLPIGELIVSISRSSIGAYCRGLGPLSGTLSPFIHLAPFPQLIRCHVTELEVAPDTQINLASVEDFQGIG